MYILFTIYLYRGKYKIIFSFIILKHRNTEIKYKLIVFQIFNEKKRYDNNIINCRAIFGIFYANKRKINLHINKWIIIIFSINKIIKIS